MPIVTQTRPLKGSTAYLSAFWSLNGARLPTGVNMDFEGSQTTTSWRSKKKGTPDYVDYEGMVGEGLRDAIFSEYSTRYDNGHDFSTQKKQFYYPDNEHVVLGKDDYIVPQTGLPGKLIYRGPLRPQSFNVDLYPIIGTPSNSTLDVVGSRIVGSVAPTASEAAAATFIGEILKDGLPRVPGIRAFRERSINAVKGSDEYLNYVFGVRPFKSDLQQMAQAVLKAAKLLTQLNRDSDRIVRRRFTQAETVRVDDLGTDTSSGSLLGLPGFNNQSPPPMFSSIPSQLVRDIVKQQYSFSGAFTYHLSQAYGFLGNLESYVQKANHLLGLEINLETIWNLTNWSWLVDWFADVGGFLHNVSLFHSNSLVMRYGYVMCHTTHTRQRTVRGLVPIGYCSHNTVNSYATVVAKQRRRATPYGFGLNEASFTDAQWAILGALGLSRAPKALRHAE